MNFSKIAEIRVKNFRCLEELVLDLTQSPITALMAGNDSGKSSTVKAIQAILYSDERDVKNYIRTGTKGFEISIKFEDNVRIVRTKTAAANTYTLYDSTSKQVNTWDRLGNDIPEVIRNIFGVKIDDATGELLNIRTCESLLLFALTKTTDNYKMVHSCISSQLIEQAYTVGNDRIKELERTINKSTALRDDLYTQANKIETLEDVSVSKVQADTAQLSAMTTIEHSLFNAMLNKLNCDEVQAQIDSTDPAKLKALVELSFTDEEIAQLVGLAEAVQAGENIAAKRAQLNTDKIETIAKNSIDSSDIEKFAALEAAQQLISTICAKKAETIDVQKLTSAAELSDDTLALKAQLDGLDSAMSMIAHVNELAQTIEALAKQLEETQNELKASTTVRYDAEQNALVKKCEHCNEETAFMLNDLSLIETP